MTRMVLRQRGIMVRRLRAHIRLQALMVHRHLVRQVEATRRLGQLDMAHLPAIHIMIIHRLLRMDLRLATQVGLLQSDTRAMDLHQGSALQPRVMGRPQGIRVIMDHLRRAGIDPRAWQVGAAAAELRPEGGKMEVEITEEKARGTAVAEEGAGTGTAMAVSQAQLRTGMGPRRGLASNLPSR